MSRFVKTTNIDCSAILLESQSFLFSEDDIYCNFKPFETGESHVCFVTGYSGSGKSTLAKKLCEKYKAEYVELDIILFAVRKGRKLDEDFLVKKTNHALIWRWIKETKQDFSFVEKLKNDNRKLVDALTKKVEELISWCISKNKKRCVIEGVDLTRILPMHLEWQSLPFVFKGTSKIKSIIRRMQRENNFKDNSIFEIIKIFKSNIDWYDRVEAGINHARALLMDRDKSNVEYRPENFIPNYDSFYVFSQSNEYDCGPAVVLSVINYLNGNVDVSLNEVASAMKTDTNGTTTDSMVQYFKAKGFGVDSVLDKGIPRDYHTFTILLNSYLGNGVPIIVENKYLDGHWRIIIGYDEENETLVITDSYAKTNNIQVVNARDFFANWYDLNNPEDQQVKQWIAVYKK